MGPHAHRSGRPRAARPHRATEYERIVRAPGPRAQPHRARALLRHVVRALLVQEQQRPPEDAAHRRPARAPGPGENAGAVDIGDGLAAVFKIESHNHPSFIEPYQGAATGVGGILRDIFTMGARPIAILNSLRFGPPDDPRTRRILGGRGGGHRRLRQRLRLPDGRRRGRVRAVLRAEPAGERVLPRPREDRRTSSRAARTAWATPSSTWAPRPAATASTARPWPRPSSARAARRSGPPCRWAIPSWRRCCSKPASRRCKTGAVVGIQDMGAAGLTCSTSEMGARAGTGIEIDIAQGAQARDRHDRLRGHALRVAGAHAARGGEGARGRDRRASSRSGTCTRRPSARSPPTSGCASSTTGALEADVPERGAHRRGARSTTGPGWSPRTRRPPRTCSPSRRPPTSAKACAARSLASPNIANKRWIYRQYDSTVRTNTLVGPGSDAAVVRVKGTRKALAMSDGRQRPLRLARPLRGRAPGRGRGLPQRRGVGRRAHRRHQLPQLRQPGAARDHGPARDGDPRASATPAARSACPSPAATCRSTTRPTARPSTRRRSSASSACSKTRRRSLDRLVRGRGRRRLPARARPREDLGGSEFLKVVHGRVAGRPPAPRPRRREAAARARGSRPRRAACCSPPTTRATAAWPWPWPSAPSAGRQPGLGGRFDLPGGAAARRPALLGVAVAHDRHHARRGAPAGLPRAATACRARGWARWVATGWSCSSGGRVLADLPVRDAARGLDEPGASLRLSRRSRAERVPARPDEAEPQPSATDHDLGAARTRTERGPREADTAPASRRAT